MCPSGGTYIDFAPLINLLLFSLPSFFIYFGLGLQISLSFVQNGVCVPLSCPICCLRYFNKVVDPEMYLTLCPKTEAKITFISQLSHLQTFGLTFSLLGICLTEMCIPVHKDTYIRKFTETLPIVASVN